MPTVLAGQIAVVTGASRGIGAAVAVQLGALGAQCVLIARTVGGLEATDDAIRRVGGPRAVLVPLDLAREQERIDALGAQLCERYGKVDLLVGNAARLGILSPLAHIDPSVWETTFALNVAANYRLLRSLDPLLRQSTAGRAVFVTCAAAKQNEPFWSLYAASKAALERLVACYNAELQHTAVKACCVDPGPAATALHQQAYPGIPDRELPPPDSAAERIIAALIAP